MKNCENCTHEINEWEEHEDRISKFKYCEYCAQEYWDNLLKREREKYAMEKERKNGKLCLF